MPPPPPPPPPPPAAHHRRDLRPHLPAVLAGAASFSLLLLFLALLLSVFLYRRFSRARTAPADSKSPRRHPAEQDEEQHHHQLRRFSYSLLRRSTSSFSPASLLGHGAFGSVHKALLPSHPSPLAVKLMSSPSAAASASAAAAATSDREFRNELSLATVLNGSPHIVSIHGYSTNRRGNRLLLVYEFMQNRSLQDALFDKKCAELAEWRRRFDIAADVARGLEYLHHCCDPPVIHGDIKPSNVLLDSEFRAKIGDFGLARLKTEEIMEEGDNVDGGVENGNVIILEEDNNGSILEELESVATGCDEGSSRCCAEQSPESCVIRVLDSEESPEVAAVSPEMGLERGSASEGCFDGTSIESGKDVNRANAGGAEKKGNSRSNWWWRQDNGGGSESGRVKDYVMEWIGSEIRKERPKSNWVSSPGAAKDEGSSRKLEPPKKQRKRWEWWASLDEDRAPKKEKKKQKPKEWWREEFCDELSKKTKKKRGHCSGDGGEVWWQQKDDGDLAQERKKRKSRSSRGSIDWWMDGLSGELRNGRRNSQEWSCTSAGDIIPKSGGISSTPSMRGTVCYIAPEYGGGGQLSEKCDVYSYGVLLLVLVSGRRPLQVTASPMAEFERANLISWARQLAQNGRLLDLLDSSIHSLDKEQALLCITIALLCLQRSPAKRPTMAEVVVMLSGEAEPPLLPFEFSPSPPSNFQF
ncbi:hypothetical protein EUGRSUZ_E01348, partial [Eucalyptus grandis]